MRYSSFVLLTVMASLPSLAASQTPLTTVRVASGLDAPVYVTAAPGDERRLFVLEQNLGRIRVIRDGQLLARPFLDIGWRISFGGEQGLLGLAFHPAYASNGLFFVSYSSGSGGDSVIARYSVTLDPEVADDNSWFEVLRIRQPDWNHNGGCIQFGPDGYLYFGLGDGGSQGDPNCNAQRGDTLLGKMLRLDVDRGSPYAIPPSNPFVGDPNVRDEIWSIGWRNPWRFSFDKLTGDLFVGDVGQDRLEEVSFQPAASRGGENYGWKVREGNLCYGNGQCPGSVPQCGSSSLVDPIHVFSSCSVIGGFVYRGCAIPDLRGTYFFGDYCSGRIWSFRYNGQVNNFTDRTGQLQPQGGWIGNISSFGQDNCGEIYIVDYTGSVYKIVAAGPPAADDLGFGSVGGNGRVPHFDVCGRLEAGNTAELRLRDAPASVPAALLVGLQMNPTSFQNGTLVPVPVSTVFSLATNQDGRVAFDIPGGFGPISIYAQYVLLDAGAPRGLGISNALRINFR